jgi:MFS family permease
MKQTTTREPGFLQGITLLSCITLAVMAVLVIAPNIPLMIGHFKDTPNAEYLVPMMVTIPALCVSIFSPFAGWVGDRFGRRRILIPCMFVYSIAGLAPAILDNLYAVIATRVVVGIMEAFVMTLSTTMIGDMFTGKKRDNWLAGQTAMASSSAVIFLLLGGLAGRMGWHGPFLIYAFPLVIMFMVILFTWEADKEHKHHSDVPHVFEPEPTAYNNFPSEEAKKKFPWKFMIWVCSITLVTSLLFYVIQIQLSMGLDALGIKDTGKIGTLTAGASLAVPLGTFVFWQASKRFNVATLLAIEFFIMGAAYYYMSLQTDYRLFVAGAAFSQIGAGMMLPTLLTWAMSRLDFEVRGRGTGMWQSTWQFGQFICGVYMPFLIAKTGGVLPAFKVQGYMGLGAFALALIAVVYIASNSKKSAQA